MSKNYQLVRLASGSHSVHCFARGETFHPAIGPVAEAEALYVHQLQLPQRIQNHAGAFVVWDVGLGAAANAITVLRATRDLPCSLQLISFDCTVEPLQFAMANAAALGYLDGYEPFLGELLRTHRVGYQQGPQAVTWRLHLGDFPALIEAANRGGSATLPAPDAILFDAFSPAKNPDMWTLPLFTNLFRLLDPERPCALPTFSRSTLLRVTLMLAGFYVGIGRAVGNKEETTIAANTPSLFADPLDRRWLERARRSHRAEPLLEPDYQTAPLSTESWEKLRQHPQFAA